jgi:hypothetical protein
MDWISHRIIHNQINKQALTGVGDFGNSFCELLETRPGLPVAGLNELKHCQYSSHPSNDS